MVKKRGDAFALLYGKLDDIRSEEVVIVINGSTNMYNKNTNQDNLKIICLLI